MFDTVDHGILLQKLCMYGVCPAALQVWFSNYLQDRVQCTEVNNVLSEFKHITCGVPQDSILGPLIFILYVNDIEGVVTDCQLSLYADDTVMYYAHSSYIELMMTIRDDVHSTSQWLNLNKLTLNTKKTKFMVFGSKTRLRLCDDIPILINGDIIERVTEFKYLGIYLDETLNFDKHIKYVHNKASDKLGAIRKIRECLDQPTALRLYKSLVLPHFDYCDTIFMTATKDNLNKLQLLQNSVCRTLLLANRETHVSDMHLTLGLLYLDERRCLHFVYRSIK